MAARATFVVFEGIDGSGKTTLSNRVADALRATGLRVVHVREGGRLASDTAENIREFTRDQKNVALRPLPELLLYVARESQQLEECVWPALADADVVIADRFFHTPEVLARFGRGLARERVEPIIRAASRGVSPRLTLLIDVDPQVARARRRAEKIARPSKRTSSRKGLAGASLMQRLRDGYLQLAAEDPSHWVVVDNTTAELGALVGELTAMVLEVRRQPESVPAAPAVRRAALDHPRDAREARQAFLAWLDVTATREPEVAAYMLHGLAGDGFDARRRALADRAPGIVASAMKGLDDEVSWELRDRLMLREPERVARSLGDLPAQSASAWQLRLALAERAPAGVASSLAGLADPRAWDLRQSLWERAADAVIASLEGDDAPAAWILREEWLARAGGEVALDLPQAARTLCGSLRGLASERAFALRQRAAVACPVGALLSLGTLTDERAWSWRERALATAPKTVMRTLDGLTDGRAFLLREAVIAGCKEALDSIIGLDDERAWALRERALDLWPSTVVKSLGLLGHQPRGRELVERQLARYPHNVSLLKHAARLAAPARAHAAAS